MLAYTEAKVHAVCHACDIEEYTHQVHGTHCAVCCGRWPCPNAGDVVAGPSTAWRTCADEDADHLVLRFRGVFCTANIDRLSRLVGCAPRLNYSLANVLELAAEAERQAVGALVHGTHLQPVTQTRVGAPQGNCTEAAIASILGVHLTAVPDLYDHVTKPTTFGPWREARFAELHRWLLDEFGLKWCQVLGDWSVAEDVLEARFGRREIRDTHYLMMGRNPDGVGHATVGRNGTMVWDPNPARRGLIDNDENVFLLPAAYFPAEARHFPGIGLTPRKEAL